MKIHTKVYSPLSENIITEILDLAELCHSEQDVAKILELLTEKIARIMQTDVCSIYLIDPLKRDLVLRASMGLNADAIGAVRMKIGEGLVGKTIEWLKPVSMAIGRKSKKFKFFPATGEEKFASFLSVPMIHNRRPVGVLVVQNEKAQRYSPRSVHLLLTLAIPAVNVIEKAKLLGSLDQVSQLKSSAGTRFGKAPTATRIQDQTLFQGIGASPGIAIAQVRIVDKEANRPAITKPSGPIHADVEKMRVLEAFRWVEEEIREVQKKANKKFGVEELSIFEAYRLVLESEPFRSEVLKEIDEGKSALQSVSAVVNRYTEELSLAQDDYIRERVFDIEDLGRKLSDRILYGSEVPKSPYVLASPAILLSQFWSISDFVEMDLDRTKGILTPSGGASSHIAILAKSLGIPAVVGLGAIVDRFDDGDMVIMDGSTGSLIVKPADQILHVYEREIRDEARAQKVYRKAAKNRAVFKDGRRMVVGANMAMVTHFHQAIENGAEEVGLYRTEFPFLLSRSLPTEEEQYLIYKKILNAMGKRGVNIRTLDIGGDKYLPYLNLPKEANPFLGWRSIRISLEREDLFRIQLKALLRASTAGTLRLLFPMISSLEEIHRVKEIVADVRRELESGGIEVARKIPLGMMIEVPSSVELAEFFIREVDFFSIGTNDLIQYTLAVDRNNSKVAQLFTPFHPAVLRAIGRTVKAAHAVRKKVGVCGEMATHPMAVVLLSGLGVDALSLSVPLISKIKNLISRIRFDECREVALSALKQDQAVKVAGLVELFLKKKGLQEFLPHPTPII